MELFSISQIVVIGDDSQIFHLFPIVIYWIFFQRLPIANDYQIFQILGFPGSANFRTSVRW